MATNRQERRWSCSARGDLDPATTWPPRSWQTSTSPPSVWGASQSGGTQAPRSVRL